MNEKLKEQHLATGNVVKLRNGELFIVVGDMLVGMEEGIYTPDYYDNLYGLTSDLDVIAVFSVDEWTGGLEDVLGRNPYYNPYLTLMRERGERKSIGEDNEDIEDLHVTVRKGTRIII